MPRWHLAGEIIKRNIMVAALRLINWFCDLLPRDTISNGGSTVEEIKGHPGHGQVENVSNCPHRKNVMAPINLTSKLIK